MDNLNNIDVVILCGGLGTRLRSVTEGIPKVLIKIGDAPLIDILINNLGQHGFRRFILCVGHLKEQVIEHCKKRGDYRIEFSEEEIPLGTGGALKKALSLVRSDSFLTVNGDTICDIDFSMFYNFHIRNGGILSMSLVKTVEINDYGIVELDGGNRIKRFIEKGTGNSDGLVNAGVYLMKREVLNYMPEDIHFSLERDLFPEIVDHPCYGFIADGKFLDIGTPERYQLAQKNLSLNVHDNNNCHP